MLRRRIFLLLVVLTATFGFATDSFAASLTAQQVLDKVAATFTNAPSLNINMTMQSGGITSQATIVLAREKFNYKIGTMQVFYDGTTQWTVNNDDKEVSITTPTPNEIAETNPLAFVQSYQQKYNVSVLSSDSKSYVIQMTAKNKQDYIRSAQVTIDSRYWFPTRVVAQLATGQTLYLNISSVIQGKALSLNVFRYDPATFKGYDVIDLR